jgi:hypothetical protein
MAAEPHDELVFEAEKKHLRDDSNDLRKKQHVKNANIQIQMSNAHFVASSHDLDAGQVEEMVDVV